MSDVKMWHCTACDVKFRNGNWLGCFNDPTRKHEVAKKTYYSEHDRLNIEWKSDRTVIDPTGQGQAVRIPGAGAAFIGGQFVTTDPECQEALDAKGYLQTEEQYLDSRTKVELKVARQKAVIEEQKTLITKLKDQLADVPVER